MSSRAMYWTEMLVGIVLALAISADGSLLIFAKLSNRRSRVNLISALYRNKEQGRQPLPPMDGFTPEDLNLHLSPTGLGWALRYAAKSCGYCKQDDENWSRVAAELRRSGYQVAVVLPSAAEEMTPESVVPAKVEQAAYMSMEWSRRFRLTVTPTLLIFGPDHRLIWFRLGMLETDDITSIKKTIEREAKRPPSQ